MIYKHRNEHERARENMIGEDGAGVPYIIILLLYTLPRIFRAVISILCYKIVAVSINYK